MIFVDYHPFLGKFSISTPLSVLGEICAFQNYCLFLKHKTIKKGPAAVVRSLLMRYA